MADEFDKFRTVPSGPKVPPPPEQDKTASASRKPASPSLATRAWDWVNKGLMSPDQALRILNVGAGPQVPRTIEGMEELRDRPPWAKIGPKGTTDIENPRDAFWRTLKAGTRESEARMMSGFTSPMSIATMRLSKLAQGSGPLAKAARAYLTAMGITYGGQGVKGMYEGAQKGVKTPEGAEETLLGASQVAGAAPAVASTSRAVKGVAAKVFPVLRTGEGAFMASMRPPVRQATALRDAYRMVKPELQQANIDTFEDLQDFAQQRKIAVARETAREIASRGGNFTIKAKPVGDAVRARVTKFMQLRAAPSGKLPIEAQIIDEEAKNVENNLNHKPLTLPEAEQIVQDINAELTKFRKLPREAQWQAIREGDPESILTAVKQSLQKQIDSQVSGYKDLKARYGAYKELETHAERRINELDRQAGTPDILTRRGAEAIGGSLGALFSGQYLHGLADILAGRGAGDFYLEVMKRPERMLKRGLKTAPPPPPFAGQITQTVSEGMKKQ